jgi:hypothetical protein
MANERKRLSNLRKWISRQIGLITEALEECRVDSVRRQLEGELRALRSFQQLAAPPDPAPKVVSNDNN